jgi:hypothetical protein
VNKNPDFSRYPYSIVLISPTTIELLSDYTRQTINPPDGNGFTDIIYHSKFGNSKAEKNYVKSNGK